MTQWPGPELLAVYDPPRLAKQPPNGPGASDGGLAERWDRGERPDPQIVEELASVGIYVRSSPAGLQYFAVDPESSEREVRQRLGADVPLTYLGASRRYLRPHPFGSWLADGDTLNLFYALPHNGEQPGGCVMVEREECVLVSLTIVDWLGAKTLRGGFTRSRATVTLQTDLGQRTVVDCSENRARPHWTTAAAVALPRPQDL